MILKSKCLLAIITSVPKSHQWCESRNAVLRTISRGYNRCRECIPVSTSFRKETVLMMSISPYIWSWKDCDCWFLVCLRGLLGHPLTSWPDLLNLCKNSMSLLPFQFRTWKTILNRGFSSTDLCIYHFCTLDVEVGFDGNVSRTVGFSTKLNHISLMVCTCIWMDDRDAWLLGRPGKRSVCWQWWDIPQSSLDPG